MNSRPFLPYGQHWIDETDISAVADVLRSPWLTTGPVVSAFEEAFARAVGARFAVACSSGTAALHLAALAADLNPGDAAVVPAMTFMATANAIRYVGGAVRFSDVDPHSGLMRPDDLEQALARAPGRVRAVLPVHLNGQTANMEAIGCIAQREGMVVIEDASHALGSIDVAADGARVPVGSCRHSHITIFSGHPVKTIAMGEGGVITTNDPAVAARLRRLRAHGITREAGEFENRDMAFDDHGRANPWYHELAELGFNYRASDLHCALGLSQLKRLDDFARRRRELAARYEEALAPLAPRVEPLARVPWCDPVLHLYALRIRFGEIAGGRAAVMRTLAEQGVGSQVHYIPVNRQPYYRRLPDFSPLPGADKYYEHCLSIPFFPVMSDADADRVVETLGSVLFPRGAKP